MKSVLRFAIATGLLLGATAAFAANNSPVGTWKTIDDKTQQAKSIVQITEVNGELQGKVIKVLQSDDGPHPVCKECDGERKNQPVEGMVILWGVKADGDVWDGGKILDPKNGKVYKVKLKTIENGTRLDVHGYIGFSLIGRSQEWIRED